MVNYANKDYITSLTTASTDGITDGVDHIHSGVIKALEAAARGNYILDYNTASFQQVAGVSKTSFGFSAVINYMRDGVVTSADPASVELSSSPHATLTRYDLIVIAADGTLACRTGTENATPTVSALTIGDIPVALVKVEAGTGVNIVTRPIQLYGYNKESNAVSVAYSTGSTYTETLTISGGATGSTIANLVGDLSLTSTDDVTVQLGSNDANSIFSITDNEGTPQTQFSVDAAGTVKVPSLTASEIVISDASDNLVSADVATYPSLTELTYVKGVTSAIQTQLDTKIAHDGSTANGVLTYKDIDEATVEANLTFNGSTLIVTGAMTASTTIVATTSVTSANVTANNLLTASDRLSRGGIQSGPSSPTTGTPLTYQSIQFLDTAAAPANHFMLPTANGNSGAVITLKNLGAGVAEVNTSGETIDGGSVTNSLILGPNIITIPSMGSVTITAYEDGVINQGGLQNPAGVFGTGWIIIGQSV